MEEFLQLLFKEYPLIAGIFGVLGAFTILGQSIVAITPSKKDDEILDKLKKNSIFKKIFDFLIRFAPYNDKHRND